MILTEKEKIKRALLRLKKIKMAMKVSALDLHSRGAMGRVERRMDRKYLADIVKRRLALRKALLEENSIYRPRVIKRVRSRIKKRMRRTR